MDREKQTPADDEPSQPSLEWVLRAETLNRDPATIGISPATSGPVWGVVIDTVTVIDGGWMSLVVLGEGSTSLYSGTPGVPTLIGYGHHESVRVASQHLLTLVTDRLERLEPATDFALPPAGSVTIRALTFSGQRAATGALEDLGAGRHPASPLFPAASALLAELRLQWESLPPHQ